MTGMHTYRIIEFLNDGVRVKGNDGKIQVLTNIILPKYAIAGDMIRWSEHQFYIVIDENGDCIYR